MRPSLVPLEVTAVDARRLTTAEPSAGPVVLLGLSFLLHKWIQWVMKSRFTFPNKSTLKVQLYLEYDIPSNIRRIKNI